MKHLSIFACLRLLLLLVFSAAIAPHGFSAQAEAPAPKPNQQADLDYGADEANEKFATQNEKIRWPGAPISTAWHCAITWAPAACRWGALAWAALTWRPMATSPASA